MTKVISLNDYQSRKRHKIHSGSCIYFNDINEGIKNLALKDKELIFRNIKYYYNHQYTQYIKRNNTSGDYSFQSYLSNKLNILQPFRINHGIDFASEYAYSDISINDWKNISDIVVRISLNHTLGIIQEQLDPLHLAQQYSWEKVQVDL
ncbi:hypothetical protein [Alkaliphilus peptidifermentans]|uniref:Uncharacterized protein n=1 Tax=Alkaliphilus peptidifermentans DSM 18978 TaxID=1120976 RepID=A0A1G5BZB6_9FIRM|nr:hypothetical protein [Alkaliphilus peptidifermentans]SCX95569.1 hypothetical protein SAMN03080606_00572 [Alkaliphilus peptidifermentans DSM 18978]